MVENLVRNFELFISNFFRFRSWRYDFNEVQ